MSTAPSSRDAVIVDAVRTPSGRGKPGGALSGIHPVDLAAHVLRATLERNGLDSRQIDDVLLGCVSQVGEQTMNIALQAVLAAGFDERVPATTIDRQCGSSQQAAHFAAQGVMAGQYDIVIAGGIESMSRVPLGIAASVAGSPFSPALHERYPAGLVNQGVSAELIASRWDLSRETLDAFAAESHRLGEAVDDRPAAREARARAEAERLSPRRGSGGASGVGTDGAVPGGHAADPAGALDLAGDLAFRHHVHAVTHADQFGHRAANQQWFFLPIVLQKFCWADATQHG